MWKKDDAPSTETTMPQPDRPTHRSEPTKTASASGDRATIGRSISIRGEVSGNEDLLIQGQVDGSVDLKQQSVTVGKEGQVKANITGRVVTVEGSVEGDLKAEEQVILRSSSRVQGDIVAPRVVLEDGANFRGGIDMGSPPATGSQGDQSKAVEATSKQEPLKSSTGSVGVPSDSKVEDKKGASTQTEKAKV